MSRPRLLVLLVLTLMWGGITHALAQEASPPGPSHAPGNPDCAAEACQDPEEEQVPEEQEPAEEKQAPAEEPESNPAVKQRSAPAPSVEEAEAPEVEPEAPPTTSVQSASRAALALADVTVDIVDSDYRPGSVTINAGDTVTWTQSGDAPHTVTADDGSFDSGQLATGETFSMRFDSPGTYRYYCTLHGGPGGEGMSGVVVVEGGGSSEGPPTVGGEEEEAETGNGGRGTNKAEPAVDGALPRTGGGPPPAWVFALALVVMGFVLARVARMSERAARG